MNDVSLIRIGTRGSELALAQAQQVQSAIEKADTASSCELIKIITEGDRNQQDPIASFGSIGRFTKELDAALREKKIDIAVHSCKDLPSTLDDDLELVALLPRNDARDTIVGVSSLEDLNEHTTVGTGSLRRQAALLQLTPKAKVTPLRGNVPSRLRKQAEGNVHAIILAQAGLNRLGLKPVPAYIFSVVQMVPAPCQGAIAVVALKNSPFSTLSASLDNTHTRIAINIERLCMREMAGGCDMPFGAYAEKTENDWCLHLFYANKNTIYQYHRTPSLPDEKTIKGWIKNLKLAAESA